VTAVALRRGYAELPRPQAIATDRSFNKELFILIDACFLSGAAAAA